MADEVGGVAGGMSSQGAQGAQSAQIGDLISGFVPDVKSEAKVEDADGKTEVAVDEREEVAEGVGDAGKVGKKKEGEAEKAAEESEEESEIEALRRQISELTARVATLTGQQPQAQPKAAPEEKATELVDKFFESRDEYNKAFEDEATMNKVLSRVAVATAQRILSNLPKVVDNIVKQQVGVQTHVREFFNANPDLVKYKEFVGYVANDLGGKNPGWTIDKLFSELGKEVRKRMGLKAQADKTPVDRDVKVRRPFPPAGGGARQPAKRPEQLSQLEKEISDLIS